MDVYDDLSHRYLDRLENLYTTIETWLQGSGLSLSRTLTQMDEGVGEPYEAPALVIGGGEGERVATVTPYGWNVIGAEGQVRIVGPYDTRIVSYFINNGPGLNGGKSANGLVSEPSRLYLLSGVEEPGWYVISDPKTGTTRRLDDALLKEILTLVSDYGA